MMPIYLEQRFHLLLNLAKECDNFHVARESLASAKEMIDTLFAVDFLTYSQSSIYHQLCTNVQIMVAVKELPKTYMSFDDGIRPAQIQN